MKRMLVSHDLRTHQEELILEAEEMAIVIYVRGRWPSLREIPINEWFIPNLREPKKFMIQTAWEEQ